MPQGVVKFTRGVPTTQMEWERVFRTLNEVLLETPDGVVVEGDNIPSTDAPFITTAPVQGLSGAKTLSSATGQTVVVETSSTVEIELAEAGTAGLYTKVLTDSKGRVVAGAALMAADMPAPLSRIYTGTGSPNGVLVETPGALYLNIAGGANTTLYVKESGSSNTGWVAK